MEPTAKKPPRKPYRRPVLQVYGDIRKLTKALVMSGNKNDMAGGPQKT
jgi:hypothetical protein